MMGAVDTGIAGFVDLQVNGYKGVDFSSADHTPASFRSACRELLSAGTAAFLPTLISSSDEVYARNLPLIAQAMDEDEFKGRIIGIHLEGPFISPGAGIGAHDPRWVRKPDGAYLDRLIGLAQGSIRMLTLAPELDGSAELIAHAVKRGIVVAAGHTTADVQALDRAAAAGATAFTHLGNAMPATVPRHDNALWAGIACDHLAATIITDGFHLPATIIKAAIRTKGIAKTIVVSDASPIAGMPPGEYTTLGNKAVLERNGKLHNPEKQCLVGSSATMLQCMNHLASLDLLSLEELLRVGYFNPLRLIGVEPDAVTGEGKILFDGKIFSVG